MGAIKIKPPSRVAVDTCILLALADHNHEAWEAVKALRDRLSPVIFLILPTVLAELCAHSHGPDPELKRLADLVFKQLREGVWADFTPTDFVGVGYGIVELAAKSLLRKQLLPDSEWNDALIFGEASLQESTFLLTEDAHFRDMDVTSTRAAINDFDLTAPTVLSCAAATQLAKSPAK